MIFNEHSVIRSVHKSYNKKDTTMYSYKCDIHQQNNKTVVLQHICAGCK